MRKRKKPPATAPADVKPETWERIGLWVADQLHDMEVDADSIAETQGADFMPALRGLAEHLRTGKGAEHRLWAACAAWRDRVKPLCEESIYQVDSTHLACPELAITVCDVIGYAEVEDE